MIEKLWVDVETTGLDPENDSIIELACLYKDKVFHKYCLPEIKPDNFDKITELTGITWEFLEENGVISEEILYSEFIVGLDQIINKYDKTDKLVITGFNPSFDSNFLRTLFKRNNNNFFGSYFFNINIDVRSLVADKWSKGLFPLLESYKLKTICNAYGIEFKAHSALEDIKATKELYEKIMEASIGST